MSIDDINQLDVKEENIESPDWHKDILEERVKKVEDGRAEFISMDELKNKIQAGKEFENE